MMRSKSEARQTQQAQDMAMVPEAEASEGAGGQEFYEDIEYHTEDEFRALVGMKNPDGESKYLPYALVAQFGPVFDETHTEAKYAKWLRQLHSGIPGAHKLNADYRWAMAERNTWYYAMALDYRAAGCPNAPRGAAMEGMTVNTIPSSMLSTKRLRAKLDEVKNAALETPPSSPGFVSFGTLLKEPWLQAQAAKIAELEAEIAKREAAQ